MVTLPMTQRRKMLLEYLGRLLWSQLPGAQTFHTKLLYGDTSWFWRHVSLSNSSPRHISFPTTNDGKMDETLRRHCSIGKFLKGKARQNGLEITDVEADAVAHEWGNLVPNNYSYRFEVVHGDELFETYYEMPGFGSCMTGKTFAGFYADNPEKVGVVRTYLDKEYLGRALVWYTDEGKTLLDSAYMKSGGPHFTALKLWAEEQGWQTNGGVNDALLEVTMQVKRTQFPYLDTFRYTNDNPSSPVITLNNRKGRYVFVSTIGDYTKVECVHTDNEVGTLCYACGEAGYEYDMEFMECVDAYVCQDCYTIHFIYLDYRTSSSRHVECVSRRDACVQCDGCREWRFIDDVSTVESDNYCDACCEELCLICDDCSDWCLSTRVTDVANDRSVCSACIYSYTQCVECEKYHSSVSMKELKKGDYCESCYDEHTENCEVCQNNHEEEETITIWNRYCCNDCAVPCEMCGCSAFPDGGPCPTCSRVPECQLAFSDLFEPAPSNPIAIQSPMQWMPAGEWTPIARASWTIPNSSELLPV